jgi:HAE1 family hydrophobic/amphiphilic exporter-1
MNFSKTSIMRPVSTIMLMLIIVVLGAISFSKLPIDLYPKMELPYAMVMIQYPNAAPTEIESMVTKPVEQQIATVENIKALYSYSMEGSSIVLCEFENGTNMDFASLNMREKVDLISDYLPDNATEPMFLTMDPTLMPVSQLYVSGDMSLEELNSLVNDEVLPALERSEGVAAASSFGGTEKEISVKFDQERLSGYGLTLTDVKNILSAENISLPSGDVKKGARSLWCVPLVSLQVWMTSDTYPLCCPRERSFICRTWPHRRNSQRANLNRAGQRSSLHRSQHYQAIHRQYRCGIQADQRSPR